LKLYKQITSGIERIARKGFATLFRSMETDTDEAMYETRRGLDIKGEKR